MKKLLSILIALSLAATAVFADETDDILDGMAQEETYEEQKAKTIMITPDADHQHVTDKNAKVTLEFNPLYDELRIHYVTYYTTFDRGEAMNTVVAILNDFMLGKIDYEGHEDYRYRNYRYLQEPKERSFIDKSGKKKVKYTEYFCYVQLRDRSPFKKAAASDSNANAETSEE